MAGGSAGMGRATAERLAEAGVELYISARREERLVRAAKRTTGRMAGQCACESIRHSYLKCCARADVPGASSARIEPQLPAPDYALPPAENFAWRRSGFHILFATMRAGNPLFHEGERKPSRR